jgi:membrane protein
LSSLAALVKSIVDDWRMLILQEVRLAGAELREALVRVQRGAALSAGGGLLLYAAALLLVTCIALLLSLMMPFWVAALLVGLLVLIEGWVLTVWARQKLNQAMQWPGDSVDSVREDIETIRAHVGKAQGGG